MNHFKLANFLHEQICIVFIFSGRKLIIYTLIIALLFNKHTNDSVLLTHLKKAKYFVLIFPHKFSTASFKSNSSQHSFLIPCIINIYVLSYRNVVIVLHRYMYGSNFKVIVTITIAFWNNTKEASSIKSIRISIVIQFLQLPIWDRNYCPNGGEVHSFFTPNKLTKNIWITTCSQEVHTLIIFISIYDSLLMSIVTLASYVSIKR